MKYAMHYGELAAADPLIRSDNHHGPHELHTGATVWEIDFPGFDALYETWRTALPPAKRTDW